MTFLAYTCSRCRDKLFSSTLIVAEIFAKRFYRNKKRWIDLQMVFDVPSLECAILSFQARQHNSLLQRSNHTHIYSDIYILFIPVRVKLNMYTHHVPFALQSLFLSGAILPVISVFSSPILLPVTFFLASQFFSRVSHRQRETWFLRIDVVYLLLRKYNSTHHIQLYPMKLILDFLC